MQRIAIEKIAVRNGKVDFEVCVPLDALYVDTATATKVLTMLPNLAQHVCVNENGQTFGDEIAGTELPHLLEHLIIEIQAHLERKAGLPTAGKGLMGHTSWLEELSSTRAQGIARMRVTSTFHDDLIALRAANQAVQIINEAG